MGEGTNDFQFMAAIHDLQPKISLSQLSTKRFRSKTALQCNTPLTNAHTRPSRRLQTALHACILRALIVTRARVLCACAQECYWRAGAWHSCLSGKSHIRPICSNLHIERETFVTFTRQRVRVTTTTIKAVNTNCYQRVASRSDTPDWPARRYVDVRYSRSTTDRVCQVSLHRLC